MNDVLVNMKNALVKPLPGKKAHIEAAPYRKVDFDKEKLPTHKVSAVLILLFPKNNEWHLALIERSKYDGKHSGQIALPGGKKEDQDNNVIETALRETEEEIGVVKKSVEVLGQLSEIFIPVSNYLVYPVIGYVNNSPNFIPDKKEVEQVLEVKLKDLLAHKTMGEGKIKFSSGTVLKTPVFKLNNQIVWGATAMMLNEFRWLLSK